MNLTMHFTLEELTATDAGARHGLSNQPPEALIPNITKCAEKMEEIRALLGYPVHINSCYRSGAVNKLVGGKPNSQHCQGLAVDFVCPSYGTPKQVAERIAASHIDFSKLIIEFDRWCHIQIGAENKRQLLTINSEGTFNGFV